MARARNIKPQFFTNDELSELPPLARLLFIGLWTIADFKGCFEYKPKRLKVQLLPYDDCDIEQLVSALDKSRFISIYSVQGQTFGKVLNFNKHQNPHKNEKEKGSDIPDIYQNNAENVMFSDNLEDIEINHDQNGSDPADSLNLIPDSCSPITDTPVSVSPKFVFKSELKKLGVSEEQASEFMQVRKAKKAVNTKNAFEMLIAESQKANLSLDQAIDYCLKRQNPWGAFKAAWYVNEQIENQNPNQPAYQTSQQRTASEMDRWKQAEQQAFGERDVTPKKFLLIEEVGHA
ncbi:hypothetical protein [Acinetobacter pseudolwoffii]|uniref:hypothetical protein n=1 Tax=Acinetobacter pseudolwoffii TaxID=2053287 RepID=UPI002468422E|nr:hypothetical protein [Acinetobacter pseudolwoffii]MDH5818982.1 hypothetical protein [Acinetobacter pseudolwoffii]